MGTRVQSSNRRRLALESAEAQLELELELERLRNSLRLMFAAYLIDRAIRVGVGLGQGWGRRLQRGYY